MTSSHPRLGNILIVEDDKNLLKICKIQLEKEGYGINVATNGVEALAILKKEKPQLILLDIMMPGKDGFAVLAELKSNTVLKKIPVIIMSNLTDTPDYQKAMRMGVKDYIIKSNVSLSLIVNKIKKYL